MRATWAFASAVQHMSKPTYLVRYTKITDLNVGVAPTLRKGAAVKIILLVLRQYHVDKIQEHASLH